MKEEDGLGFLPDGLGGPVRGALARVEAAAGSPTGRLAAEGARILRESAERAGARDHANAFDLLTADGLLTMACEAAADAPDPESELRSVLDALLERLD